jgi:hypothetical protein
MTATPTLVVEFCGEEHPLDPATPFGVGRAADLIVDNDNAYLHRRLIEFSFDGDFWWIANVGSRLGVTVSGDRGSLVSWLGPGSRGPVVMPELAVMFSAGGTTYELGVSASLRTFVPRHDLDHADARRRPRGERSAGVIRGATRRPRPGTSIVDLSLTYR